MSTDGGTAQDGSHRPDEECLAGNGGQCPSLECTLCRRIPASIGVAPRGGLAYTPQTKGKVERGVGRGFAEVSFREFPSRTLMISIGRHTLGASASIAVSIARLMNVPVIADVRSPLTPLPTAFAWEREAHEERKVSWDGYLSYDGVLYGLPSDPPVAGTLVQVRERHGRLSVWSGGGRLSELAKRPRSQEIVTHPDQFRTVAPAASLRERTVPLGHLRPVPVVATRARASV